MASSSSQRIYYPFLSCVRFDHSLQKSDLSDGHFRKLAIICSGRGGGEGRLEQGETSSKEQVEK